MLILFIQYRNMPSETTIDYEELVRQVAAAGIESTLPEIHGILCGLLCGKAPDTANLWSEALFSDIEDNGAQVAECRKSLDTVFHHTVNQLTEDRMELSLLLPDEEQEAVVRAAAIRDWCQGFLFGFGLAGRQPESLFSQDAGEAIRDFREISRMDVEEMGDASETEEALAHLEEYLWVAALLVYQDVLASKRIH